MCVRARARAGRPGVGLLGALVSQTVAPLLRFFPGQKSEAMGPKKNRSRKAIGFEGEIFLGPTIGSLARRRRFLTDRVFVASDKRAHRHRHRDRRHAGRDSASLPRVPGQISTVELKHEFHSNRGKRTNRIRLRLHLAYFILSAFR